MSDTARYERDGDLGVITIANPPLNLFDADLIGALPRAVAAAADDAPRALLIRAEGKLFTGGVDVAVFKGLSEADGRALTADLLEVTHQLEDMPFPTVAAVHGLCLTAGFELSLACDLIWADTSARFGLVEIVVGLTPLMGGTQRVAERAGPARARELVMTGELYPAETLERWGVVNRVVADGELDEQATKLARRLAAGPTRANAATKAIVRAQTDAGTRGADASTADLGAPLFETRDLQRAVETFLSEGPGKATFEGR